jgi:hypothetical protein
VALGGEHVVNLPRRNALCRQRFHLRQGALLGWDGYERAIRVRHSQNHQVKKQYLPIM